MYFAKFAVESLIRETEMSITDGPAPKPIGQARNQMVVVEIKDAIKSDVGIELLSVSYGGPLGHVSWALFGMPQEMGFRIDLGKEILFPGDIDELYEKHIICMAQRDFLLQAGEKIVEHLARVEESNKERRRKVLDLTVQRIQTRRQLDAIEKELVRLLGF